MMELVKALDDFIPEPKRDLDKPFLMPIEDIFSIKGRGTVATGRIEQVSLKLTTKSKLSVSDQPPRAVVTGIEAFKKSLDQGQAGDDAGILLRGIERDDIERGQVLAKPGTITPHTEFDAEVYILNKEEGGRTRHSLRATNRNSTSVPQMLPVKSSYQQTKKWLCPATP